MGDLSTLDLLSVPPPSFFGGMGRLLDVGAVMGPVLDTRDRASFDGRAILSDWVMAGEDVQRAADSLGE